MSLIIAAGHDLNATLVWNVPRERENNMGWALERFNGRIQANELKLMVADAKNEYLYT